MLKKISNVMLILLFLVTISVMSCGKTNDVDIMLSQYEKMIEKYTPLMQKAAKGGDGTSKEMEKMGKEMEEWSKKWEDKMKDLSKEDMVKVQKRMMEIAQKMYQK